MEYGGTDEQLINALKHIASRKSTCATDAVVCQAAAERLRDFVGEYEPEIDLLEGQIEIGQKFIWEPSLPHAYCRLIVTDITQDRWGDGIIWSRDLDKPDTKPNWNDESRFREACVRV